MVEKANHTAAQRWWRALPDDLTPEAAHGSLDAFCASRGNARLCTLGGRRGSVLTHAAAERLAPLPASFPPVLTAERKVSAQALVAYRGNLYSVPPQLTGAPVAERAKQLAEWKPGLRKGARVPTPSFGQGRRTPVDQGNGATWGAVLRGHD